MTGHASVVQGLIQINQNQVASASMDFTIKIWNITTNSLINTYNGHTNVVTSLVVLSNGKLASGGADSKICLWNTQQNTLASSFNATGPVFAMMINPTVSPNGTLIVAIRNYLNFYNAYNLTLLKSAITGRAECSALEILLPSGNILLAGAFMNVYNSSGSLIFSQNSSFTTVIIVRAKLLPDNVTVALGLSNGTLLLFNSNLNTFGAAYSAHTGCIYFLGLTPDRLYLVSGALDKNVILWTSSTMSLTQVNMFSVADIILSAAFIPTTFTGNTI
jgi:WD40 repeat protein